jgi:putative DNA primase/helicase
VKSKDKSLERKDAARVAADVLEHLGDRPGEDDPEGRAQWDAIAKAARGGLDDELAFKPLTDLGNAERFKARNANTLHHVDAIGWLAWDGRRWAREGADVAVQKAVHATVRAIQDEADAIRDTEKDLEVDRKKDEPVMLSDRVAGWGRASESATKIAAIQKLAAPYLSVEAAALDADPLQINVLNGTIRISRAPGDEDPVSFTPHDPSQMITKLAPVIYDPVATCPTYDEFLKEVQPTPETRRFLHQWGGYSLTGDIGEHKLCFNYGKGRNGKSTLMDAWGAVAGDYGETVPIETFLDQGRGRNAGAATPDLALLPGVRMLRTSEPEKGAKLAESLIKLTTGGEPIQARHLNRDYFKFRPQFKLTMSGNYRPSVSGTDEGIWRRVVLIPWSVTVAAPDPLLPTKLLAETSGILNRLLDGLRDYLENGLILPGEVADATADYRDDSDPLGRFLAECVEAASGERVSSQAMHRLFVAWARADGEREWSQKGLAMALKERRFRSKHSNGMSWLDCRLVKTEAHFADPAPPSKEAAEE